MPVHDWTRVEAGIFHDFHHAWIEEIKRALNADLMPQDYYALAEQFAGGFGPDVLTLQERSANGTGGAVPTGAPGGSGVLLAPPKVRLTGVADQDHYLRKQNVVVVRHVSGDRVVAVAEVVSPGNKSTPYALRRFVEKAAELVRGGIHVLVLDLHPPGPRDPHGLHALIWEQIAGQEYFPPAGKPLTLAAYESDIATRAYVEAVAVGDTLTAMPLFLAPGAHVEVPLEATYDAAFAAVPRRWRRVLECGPAV